MTGVESSSHGFKTAGTKLISSYYPQSFTLENYLLDLVHGAKIIEPEDEHAYQTLVRESWVGLEQGVERRVFENVQPSETQGEVSSDIRN